MTIPILSLDVAEAELNSFLQSHRVLSVERRWVDQGSQSFWAICIHRPVRMEQSIWQNAREDRPVLVTDLG